MTQREKFAAKLMSGRADASIDFDQLRALLLALGFAERVQGDHHVFVKEGASELINVQPDGRHAKPFQVKQVRAILSKYKLAG